MATSDPIAEIIGDYRAFAAMQRDRLVARGIDIAPYPLSHLAVRVADWDLYVHQRTLLERHARANSEDVWNGRPISKIVLAEPLDVLDGTPVSLIELIPPVHQRVYRMGLEHLGIVVGEEVDAFSREHRAALTGQQFQNADCEPYYVLLEDFTHVKFYRRSLYDVCVLEGATFDGFVHAEEAEARKVAYDFELNKLAYLVDAGVPDWAALRLTSLGFERADAARLSRAYFGSREARETADILGWLRAQPDEQLAVIVQGADRRRIDFDFFTLVNELREGAGAS